MESKKQSSVEWLVNVVQSCIAPDYIPKEIVEQAKEMEKQQIIDACNQEEFEDIDGYGIHETISKGEQYYKETFNNE